MQTEEILYKTSSTGTTAFYFVPNATPALVPFLEEPAYMVFDNSGNPIDYKILGSGDTSSTLWSLQNINGYNINTQLSSVTTNYITGYSISNTIKKVLSDSEKTQIQQRFHDNVLSTVTAQTQYSIINKTYVIFKEQEIDDMYANIKLSRSYETLDTLKIYNTPINTIPQQEAQTGILFGKLQAIQILKDEVGNNIKIPLRNVPIGIFNASTEFPTPMSLDDNGDRFFMNIKESIDPNQYFDFTAYTEDQKFLKSQSQFTSVPDKFRYITTTNDNGEFVIYNAPVGGSVVVFEVDLFKQGLTKDEIALNNFPFPVNDDANIGQFPCYYYNQIPVDVVPAWGTVQTGYTEVNINVNLDLRKWATYIFAPASYANEKLEVTAAKNSNNTFKIQVRDMTNKLFKSKILETTQIPSDLDRRSGAEYYWFNEILDQRQQLDFFKFGCHVIKLPANLYDPNAYKTDSDGIPVTNGIRGLWLASYQFSTFVNSKVCIRNTGGYSFGGDFWSHFDVNYFSGSTANDTVPFAGLNKFPYEKPWSISYPEPYSIPTKPMQKRFDWGPQRTYQSPYILEEPAYSDGDLVGSVLTDSTHQDGLAGGFGIQFNNQVSFPNQIAYVATKSYMYKYEKGVRWDEKYANGYEPLWNQNAIGPYSAVPLIAGMSSVNKGEKYQRVECGHGYFMKYNNWPRVYRNWNIDLYFEKDAGSAPGVSTAGIFGDFSTVQQFNHQTYNIDDQNFAFAFDKQTNGSTNKEGIDIYRIVKSGLGNIQTPENFVVPTFVNIEVQTVSGPIVNNKSFDITNKGAINVSFVNNFSLLTIVDPTGVNLGSVPFGSTFILTPGSTFTAFFSGIVYLTLNGNDSYNSSTNKYEVALYTFKDNNLNIETQFNYPSINSDKNSQIVDVINL